MDFFFFVIQFGGLFRTEKAKKRKTPRGCVLKCVPLLILDLNQNGASYPAVWPQRRHNIRDGLASSPKPKQHVFCGTADGGWGGLDQYERMLLTSLGRLSQSFQSCPNHKGQITWREDRREREREREREKERKRGAAHALKTEESYGVWGWSRWRSEFNK